MTALELKNYFREQLVRVRTISQEINVFDAFVDFITQAVTDGIPSWTVLLTFNTDGTGAGKFCTATDTESHLRFWQTKTDGNINHAPPTDPDIDEDAFWKEVSPSDGSAIKEWTPGIYQAGLQIVYYDVTGAGKQPALFLLAEADRPFTSADFFAELGSGAWIQLNSYNYEPLDSTAAPIVVDCEKQSKCAFKGTDAIGAAKTWNFVNTDFLRECKIWIELSTADIQTFNDVICSDGAFADGDWTPPVPGKYSLQIMSDGNELRLDIFGPYNS